jgi:hypothetical protein
MSRMKIAQFAASAQLLLAVIELCLAFDPNVRFHEPAQSNQRWNYSYVNLKKVPGCRLNTTPYISITVTNQSLCIKECLKTNGICRSINLRTLSVDYHECEILPTDIYREPSSFVQESDYNHFLIKVRTIHGPVSLFVWDFINKFKPSTLCFCDQSWVFSRVRLGSSVQIWPKPF